jgi:hypothetical protein
MDDEFIDKIILVAANALEAGVPIDILRNAIINRGWSEGEAYLFIVAGKTLLKYRNER